MYIVHFIVHAHPHYSHPVHVKDKRAHFKTKNAFLRSDKG